MRGSQASPTTFKNVGGDAIALSWQPPALGNIDAGLDLADLLCHPLVEQANQVAMERYLNAQPVLVDVMMANEAIPAMAERKLILHSGPPIRWENMFGTIGL